MLQSHATAYFYLVVPEMMFGMDAAPEQRNLLGLLEADPALVTRVVKLRKWGQELLRAVFGKRMHGVSAVPGGVQKPLTAAERDRFVQGDDGIISLAEVMEYAHDGLALFREFHARAPRRGRLVRGGAGSRTCRLVGPDGERRLLRRPAARGRRRTGSVVDGVRLPRLPRPLLRGGGGVELHEVPLPQGAGPRGRHGAGGLAGADERDRPPAHPARGRGAGGASTTTPPAGPTR